MEATSELPTTDEVSKVFRDYRRVLKETSFLTPLQRGQRLVSRANSVHYQQRYENSSMKVKSLLPPGLQTRLDIDFYRILPKHDSNIALKIPLTLLSQTSGCTLMKTMDSGLIRLRRFLDRERGLRVLGEEIRRLGKGRSPLLVFRRENEMIRICTDWEEAMECWRTDVATVQMLQQYVHPYSRNTRILRVHWQESHSKPTFYYLNHQASKSTIPPLLPSRPDVLSRSRSVLSSTVNNPEDVYPETAYIAPKTLPELLKPLETCLKVLQLSLGNGEKVSEFVCDFISDQQHEWVFLACKGLTFTCKKRLLTKILEASQPITLNYLFYPLVVNKPFFQSRMHWENKLRGIAKQHNLSVAAMMNTLHDYSTLVGDSPTVEKVQEKQTVDRKNRPKSEKICLESEIITKGVTRYEQIRMKSRLSKENAKHGVDYLGKYGGLQVWHSALVVFAQRLQTLHTISDLFADRMSFDELRAFSNGLVRVLKGDFNLYYKEGLRKVHQRAAISKGLFAVFLEEVEVMVWGVTQDKTDTSLIYQRFLSLQEYICAK